MGANPLDGLFGITKIELGGVSAAFHQKINLLGGWSSAVTTDTDGNPRLDLTPPGGGGGGSAALISRTRIVDKGTTVAPENQLGTFASPFSTVAAAAASLLTLESGETSPPYHYTILTFPGDYSGEDPVAWDTSTYGISLTIAAAVQGGYDAGQVVLPALVGRSTAGQLKLTGVYALNGISGGWGGVVAEGCKLGGTIALGTNRLDTVNCWLDHPTLTCGGLHARGGLVEATTINCGTTSVTIFGAFGSAITTLVFTGSAGVFKTDTVTNAGLGSTVVTNGTKTVL